MITSITYVIHCLSFGPFFRKSLSYDDDSGFRDFGNPYFVARMVLGPIFELDQKSFPIVASNVHTFAAVLSPVIECREQSVPRLAVVPGRGTS